MKQYALIFASLAITQGCNDGTRFGSGKASEDQTAAYPKTFVTTISDPLAFNLTGQARFVKQDVTLKEKAPEKVVLSQMDRTKYEENWRQGNDSDRSSEPIKLSEAGKLDILLVIDDSGSMEDEQEKMGDRLLSLLSNINTTNWQIAAVSMSDSCVTDANLMKRSDPLTDAERVAKFRAMVNKGTKHDDEQGFPMALAALAGTCKNSSIPKPWIRSDSTIGIIFLSDEDNCGSNANERNRCKNLPGKDADDFILRLKNDLKVFERTRAYGIYRLPAAPNFCDGSAPAIAHEYRKAVEATHPAGTTGIDDQVCAGSYAPVLTSISANISRMVTREFDLMQLPDGKDFVIKTKDGTDVTAGFQIMGKKVKLIDDTLKSIEEVIVSYSHGFVSKFDKVTLEKNKPAKGTLEVLVNGKALAATDYSFDDQTKVITFVSTPSDKALIEAKYREDVELPVTFDIALPEDMVDGTLKIEMDGKEVTSATYADKRLSFTEAPQDGKKINLSFRRPDGWVKEYDIDFHGLPIAAVLLQDAKTGQAVPSEWKDGKVTLAQEEIRDGRQLIVTGDLGPAASDYRVPRTASIDYNSLKVTVGGALSPDCKNSLEEEDDQLVLHCHIDEGADIKVSYASVRERINRFTMPDYIPDLPSTGWRVFINDLETMNYKRSGRVFEVPLEDLPLGAEVRIEAAVVSPKTP